MPPPYIPPMPPNRLYGELYELMPLIPPYPYGEEYGDVRFVCTLAVAGRRSSLRALCRRRYVERNVSKHLNSMSSSCGVDKLADEPTIADQGISATTHSMAGKCAGHWTWRW
ncbi:hypothetical protein AC579_2783 [Pseudocercospora musae]|uniref:Uncharacterized protein n=1 Tax=Pseudocercospora musae TaxID=113226 RepID=A0A139H1M5_9PEZI|nr:hypothetical protein AC579_2783 [Pseudocercospora musae]